MTASPCTCFRARKLARLLTQRYDQALAPAGLGVNQFSILRHVRSLKSASISELAARLGMERSTLSRDLKPLLANGWLSAAPGEDARQRRIALTEAGGEIIRVATPLWRRVQDGVNRNLGASPVQRLHEQLDATLAALEQAAP